MAPTTTTVGVGRAAKLGVLFKNASASEAAAGLQTVVLVKTSTLPEWQPTLTTLVPAAGTTRDVLAATGGVGRPIVAASAVYGDRAGRGGPGPEAGWNLRLQLAPR